MEIFVFFCKKTQKLTRMGDTALQLNAPKFTQLLSQSKKTEAKPAHRLASHGSNDSSFGNFYKATLRSGFFLSIFLKIPIEIGCQPAQNKA